MNEIRENVLSIWRELNRGYGYHLPYILREADVDDECLMVGESIVASPEMFRDLMNRCDEKLKAVSDEECLRAYGEMESKFFKMCNGELASNIMDYRKDLWSSGCERSVEYMEGIKEKWLNMALKCDFVAGCKDFMNKYFNCVGGRYSLKNKVGLARYYYVMREEVSDYDMYDYFMNMSMVEAVQVSILDLRNDDEHKLTEITEFKPFEVLDFVERVAEFSAIDKKLLRKIWVKIMLRYDQITMKRGGKIVRSLCVNLIDDGFNKRFVIGLIGFMHSKGLYRGEFTAMRRALDDVRLEDSSVDHYLVVKLSELRMTKDAMNVINEVIGTRE